MARKFLIGCVLVLALAMATIVPSLGQSTTKQLSTNFTVINLGEGPAEGIVQYFKTDGTQWGSGSETFTISTFGGQAIFRQYNPVGQPGNPNLTDGAGSVVISANQPLGAVVQILARNQDPTTSGAYSGFAKGDTSYYVPLVARNLQTASGLANSQIVVQNVSSKVIDVEINLINPDGTTKYTKSGITIQPSASYYYDLALESSTNVPDNWYGSAVVRTTTSDGAIAVVSNFFTGDAMQTFNAFPSTSPTTKWFIPLFTSRLANSLSTPVAVQNLSGSTIPANGVKLICQPDPALSGYTPFTKTNTVEIKNTAAYYFNPVVDTSIPEGFYGSCVVEASANVVVFVQMRFIATGEAAAHEAFPVSSTDTKVFIPLVAQRLANGFATAVTIQNLSGEQATFKLTYRRSPDCTVGPVTYSPPDQTVGPYASLIQNHRTGVSGLVDGWFGTLSVESNKPVAAFVQLTFLRSINPNLPRGDLYMAHNAFTQP
ncbi:MAG: hypothetical protein QXH03_08650 [Candidatus Bathyarchaeia archaeon]